MDEQFKLPLFNFRFGLDPIIGLIPGAGDLISFAISLLIIKSLMDAGLPRGLITKMVFATLLDLAIGAIPLVGDAWDFFFKANRRNLKLAKAFFESQVPQRGK